MDSNELLILRYLLGVLSPGENDQVEERYFSDDAFFDVVQAREDELIRDYVCGVLPEPQRTQFTKKYLTNPHLREKVVVVEALRSTASRPVGVRLPVEPLSARLARWLRFRSPVLRLAGAFALVMLAVGIWYGARTSVLPQRHGPSQVGRQGGLAPPVSTMASFVLAPGTSRGGPDQNHRLTVPAGVRTVRLELQLLAPADYRTYRVELLVLGPSGMQSVTTFKDLAAETRMDGRVVSLDLDASVLDNADYVAHLAGITASGSYEDLPSYSFSVEKR